MPKIPSLERTEDFIIRKVIERGSVQPADTEPNCLVEWIFMDPQKSMDLPPVELDALHSFDITVHRDGQRVGDVHLRSFQSAEDNVIALELVDDNHVVAEHEYVVTMILRYLVRACAALAKPPLQQAV